MERSDVAASFDWAAMVICEASASSVVWRRDHCSECSEIDDRIAHALSRTGTAMMHVMTAANKDAHCTEGFTERS